MYYKITNQECEVYKKLHEMRSKELQIEIDNVKLIEEKTGLKWQNYLGHSGQQNLCRVTHYSGFEFFEPEKVDLKIWKRDKKHTDVFIPNTRTVKGRDISDFLTNGLGKSSFSAVWDILDLPHLGSFSFPYVEIVGETLILYLDNKHIPADKNVVEITSVEFESIRTS